MATSGVGSLSETAITIPVSNPPESGSLFGRVITAIKVAKCLDWLLRIDSVHSQQILLNTILAVAFVSFVIFSLCVVTACAGFVFGAAIGATGVTVTFGFFALAVLSSLARKQLENYYERYNYPEKTNEMMDLFLRRHYQHHTFTPELAKQLLSKYIVRLDPANTYFLESEISHWLNPSEALTQSIIDDYRKNEFPVFHGIQEAFDRAIKRREELEAKNLAPAKQIVHLEKMSRPKNEKELEERFPFLLARKIMIRLKQGIKSEEEALKKIYKKWQKRRQEFLATDRNQRDKCVRHRVLKAFASSLDPHTAFYTSAEYKKILTHEKKIVCGVGICIIPADQGLRITKIFEHSPAAENQQLKVNDIILAVDGKPDGKIEGEEGKPVVLTVLRIVQEGETKKETKLDISIQRRQFSSSRSESSIEPYQEGVIAYIKLESFFESRISSSTLEVVEALKKFKKEHLIKGVILDLRSNLGGLQSEAMNVLGAFISQGVLSVLNSPLDGMQYDRKMDAETQWDGPLFVMINGYSASASELVALSLQDYGRALIVGDAYSYGKGSALLSSTNDSSKINPNGEYRYSYAQFHTVSGRTPLGVGVQSDIVIPGLYAQVQIGDRFQKPPLTNKRIKPMYDDLANLGCLARLMGYHPQEKMTTYDPYIETLKKNSAERLAANAAYQAFREECKKPEKMFLDKEEGLFTDIEAPDFQLIETKAVMKDLLTLMIANPQASESV